MTPTGTITATATPPSGGKKYNDTAPDITKTGSWSEKSPALSCLVHGDYADASKNQSNTASLTFNGTIIKYFYVKKPGFGNVDILIDGSVVKTVNEDGALNCKGFKSEPLSPGQHTILVRPNSSSTGDISLDAFKVVP
jgi:hypothetical protein